MGHPPTMCCAVPVLARKLGIPVLLLPGKASFDLGKALNVKRTSILEFLFNNNNNNSTNNYNDDSTYIGDDKDDDKTNDDNGNDDDINDNNEMRDARIANSFVSFITDQISLPT